MVRDLLSRIFYQVSQLQYSTDHTVMDAASAKFTKQITEVGSFKRASSAPLQINSSADDPFTSMSRSVRQSAQQDQIGMFTYMAHVYNANL